MELGVLAEALKSCNKCGIPLQLHHINGIYKHLRAGCNPRAIIQAGRGVTQFNSILGALNIPPIHHKMVVNRQAEIGPHIETVAKDSTEQSLEEENLLTGGTVNEEREISASVDAG